MVPDDNAPADPGPQGGASPDGGADAGQGQSTQDGPAGGEQKSGEATGTDHADTAGEKGRTSGTAATAATSRSGGSNTLREHELASQHILGDQIAGDKVVYLSGGGRRLRLNSLSPRLAESVRHAFVEPVGWRDLRTRFGMHRIVILRGSQGRGRTATAVRLLQTVSVATVYELDPATDLQELAELLESSGSSDRQLAQGDAFLLGAPADFGRVTGFALRALEAPLRDIGGRLVIVVGQDVILVDDEVRQYVVDLIGEPPARAVFDSHLRRHLGATRATQTADLADLKQLLEDLLPDSASFELAAMIAERISWEPEDAIDFARVRARIAGRRSGDPFGDWFAGLPDLSTRTFAIALAVLDGLPYADVARAAMALRARLDSTQRIVAAADLTQTPDPVDPMLTANRHRLQYLQAVTEPGHVRLSIGRVPVTVVRYREQSTARKVIERAWLEYQIQDQMLEWLRGLVDDPAEQVRAFAANSLGLLARLSFDRVLSQVLYPLATDEVEERREAAALALRAAADDERVRPAVNSLVGGWFTDSDTELKATAARAHGLILGRRDLPAAIDALGRLSTVDEIAIAVAIGQGLSDLVVNDLEGATPVILSALLRWMDELKRAPTAQLAFLIVAVRTVSDVLSEDGQTVQKTWPAMLYLVTNEPALRSPLTTLWRRVIDEGRMANESERVLAGWAGRAESEQDIRDAFTRLVRAVANDGPTARRTLLRLARDWVDPDRLKPLPQVAAAVRSALHEREDRHGQR